MLRMRLFDRGRNGTVLSQQAEMFLIHPKASVNALQQAANLMGHATRRGGAEHAQMGEGVQTEPDWDLAAQPAPDFDADQRVNW